MTTIIVGNFDGVHIGHQGLIRRARELDPSGDVIAVTFDIHPATMTRGVSPAMLTTNEERAQLLMRSGVTRVECLETNHELLSLAPEAFVEMLKRRFEFSRVVEGADFRFGRGRAGDVMVLREIGKRRGFETIVAANVDAVLQDGMVVCARSSAIRWLLAQGRVLDASRMLGRPYSVCGVVTRGQQRGRQLGFPTANLSQTATVLPGDGVYAVRAEASSGRSWRGAASIGSNPTFGDCPRTLEVHLLELPHTTDLYGQTLRVSFDRWLRGMLRFDRIDELVSQIARDCERVGA